MPALNKQEMQAIDRNFSLVVDFLDRTLSKPTINLSDVPCYFYQRNETKMEIVVFSDPRIAKIDVRMIKLKNYDREPFFEESYDIDGLSMTMFERAIVDLISKVDRGEVE